MRTLLRGIAALAICCLLAGAALGASRGDEIQALLEAGGVGGMAEHLRKLGDKDRVIDADKGLYGLAFGSSVDQAYEHFGKPVGVLQVSETKLLLFYGKSHALTFRNGKLFAVSLSDHLIDFDLSRSMEGSPFFDRGWTLSQGITKGMSKERIEELLQKNIPADAYEWSFDTASAVVTLRFSSTSGPWPFKRERFHVRGVSIVSHEAKREDAPGL